MKNFYFVKSMARMFAVAVLFIGAQSEMSAQSAEQRNENLKEQQMNKLREAQANAQRLQAEAQKAQMEYECMARSLNMPVVNTSASQPQGMTSGKNARRVQDGTLQLDSTITVTEDGLNDLKLEYAYNEDGKMTLEAWYQRESHDSDWYCAGKTVEDYDDAGNQTYFAQYQRDLDTKVLYCYSEVTREFNDNGNVMYSHQNSYDATGAVAYKYNYDFTYDENGNLITETYTFYWAEMDLESVSVTDYTNNENGYPVESKQYSLKNGEKVLQSTCTYYYSGKSSAVKCTQRNADGTVKIYDLSGSQIEEMTKGINIVRANGETRKVMKH